MTTFALLRRDKTPAPKRAASRPRAERAAASATPAAAQPAPPSALPPRAPQRASLWLNRVVQLAAMGVVLVLVTVAVVLTGWDSGFHYLLLALVPPLLMGSAANPRHTLLWVLALGAYYLVLDRVCRMLPPWHTLGPAALQALRVLNIGCTFGALAWLSQRGAARVQRAEQSAQALATTDVLTGLANRRRMTELVDYELTQRRRRPLPLCVLLIDVDQLKRVNERHGHAMGDRVLQAVSQVLGQVLRAQDSVARWGGEEFLVLLPATDAAGAALVAERLRAAVAALKLRSDDEAVPVTTTIGLAEHRGESPDPWIARAGAALLRAKQGGANRVEVAPLM